MDGKSEFRSSLYYKGVATMTSFCNPQVSIRRLNEEKTAESMEALEKIRRRFFRDVLFPRMIVKGIR